MQLVETRTNRVNGKNDAVRTERTGPREERRWAWMDNLRVAVIAGVVVTHVAITYVLDIDWYYEERTANPITEAIVAAVILPAALFALATLFLIAGLLSQRSLARKGPRAFVQDRLVRLGVPLAAFVVLIGPLTSIVGQRAERNPSADDAGSFFMDEMRRADTGPMWFVTALLVFSILYGAWRWARPASATVQPLQPRHLVVAGAAIVFGSFVVRLAWPFTADTPLSLNLWEWPQMATLFAFGALAGERGWLEPIPDWLRRTCARAGIVGVATLLVVVAAVAMARDDDVFLGGWHLQAVAEPAAEAALAVAMSLWLLGWFSRRWTYNGPLARALGRASFAAYILHAPVVVLLAVGFRSVGVAGEIKFVTVATLGFATSFAVGWLVTRVRPFSHLL